jgi:hypothetical protein
VDLNGRKLSVVCYMSSILVCFMGMAEVFGISSASDGLSLRSDLCRLMRSVFVIIATITIIMFICFVNTAEIFLGITQKR